LGEKFEKSNPSTGRGDSSESEKRTAKLLSDVFPAVTKDEQRLSGLTGELQSAPSQAGETGSMAVAQANPNQLTSDGKAAKDAFDRAAPLDNGDIFTHPPSGMAVFADFIGGLKPGDPNARALDWITKSADRLYIQTKLSELAVRAKLEVNLAEKMNDQANKGLPLNRREPRFIRESIDVYKGILDDGNFSDEHLGALSKKEPSLDSVLALETKEERKAFCLKQWTELNTLFESASANRVAYRENIDNLNRKIEKLEGFPFDLSQGEVFGYLKEEFRQEAKDLNEPGGRLKREEVFGAKWGENTLIGASVNQTGKGAITPYANDLFDAISSLRSVPEAIKFVDFISNARRKDISISSANSLDSWRLDQPRKRFVVVIEGDALPGDPVQMSRERDLFNRSAGTLVNSLQSYGRQIEDSQHEDQYAKALEGKYDLNQKGKSTTVIKYVKASEKQGESEQRIQQASADMKKFRDNNPNAEFMIIESGHGSSYLPIFAVDFPAPDNLGEYYKKEGSWKSSFILSNDFRMDEDYEKKIWQGAAGDAPLIMLKTSCHSGAAIAKRDSAPRGAVYLAGDISH
jgi:hypothetical protein